MTCWLAQFSDEPCDGVEDLCHLIPKQLIKREIVGGFGGPLWPATLASRVVWHPSVYVPGCRHHHGMLDDARTLRIPREAIPAQTERFAAAFGLTYWLDREYGLRATAPRVASRS